MTAVLTYYCLPISDNYYNTLVQIKCIGIEEILVRSEARTLAEITTRNQRTLVTVECRSLMDVDKTLDANN